MALHLKTQPLIDQTLNLLFPPRCLICKTLVDRHGAICSDCWPQIHFINTPQCPSCGIPFEYDLGEGALCGECMREPPLYRKARAAFRYDEHSRKLITRFKYNDGTYLLPTLTDMLERAGSELITQSDLIIPVPLHTKRLLARRYNQSAMLAASLSKQTGVPTLLNGITRTRNTPQQAGLTKRQREKNMQGAFNIPEKYKPHIAHQSVLLIDDVMTTGSTLLSCTKALLKAKAKDVYVLTLARTVNPL